MITTLKIAAAIMLITSGITLALYAWFIPVGLCLSCAASGSAVVLALVIIGYLHRRRRRNRGRPEAKEGMNISKAEAIYRDIKTFATRNGFDIVMDGKAFEGPHTITYTLLVRGVDNAAKFRGEKFRGALSSILNLEVAFQQATRGVKLIVTKPDGEQMSPKARLMVKAARGLDIPVAISYDGRPVKINMTDHGALGFIGPSRVGKTSAMQTYLYELISSAKIEFVVCALNSKINREADAQSWGFFRDVAGCLGMPENWNEMIACIEWLENRMHRNELVVPTFLIIDDMLSITNAIGDHVGDTIDSIAISGAGLNLHLIIGAHDAASQRDLGGKKVSATMTARVVFRPTSATSAASSTGMRQDLADPLKLSNAMGDTLTIINGGVIRSATGYITRGDIDTLPRGTQTHPWLVNEAHARKANNVSRETFSTGYATTAERSAPPPSPPNTGQNGGNRGGSRSARRTAENAERGAESVEYAARSGVRSDNEDSAERSADAERSEEGFSAVARNLDDHPIWDLSPLEMAGMSADELHRLLSDVFPISQGDAISQDVQSIIRMIAPHVSVAKLCWIVFSMDVEKPFRNAANAKRRDFLGSIYS